METRARDIASEYWSLKIDEEPIPIWVDCDTGHDDAFALLLAGCCPRFRLLGVSTVHGNASLANTTQNTSSVLNAIGREDVIVNPGAAKPFCREPVHAESIHGETGLDGTTLLPPPTAASIDIKTPALTAIYNGLMSCPPNTAWLVTTGALTNAALLFAMHPQLVDHIAGLSIMGGAVGGLFTNAPMGHGTDRITFLGDVWRKVPHGLKLESCTPSEHFAELLRKEKLLPPSTVDEAVCTASDEEEDSRIVALLQLARSDFGNWTQYAEFNIYIDPESAKAVFSNAALAAKTTLIPLDVTHQVLANEEVMRRLGLVARPEDGYTPSRLRSLFHEILTFFAATYAQQLGMRDGPPLHDPLAVAAALAPGLFDDNGGERYEVYVVTDGDDSLYEHTRNVHDVGECGRTVLTMVKAGMAGVRVPRTLDIEAFWEMIGMALYAAEARSKMG